MTTEKITGATPQEWDTFSSAAGVSELVPIAIDGEPEEGSRLSTKMLGKVPSRYNANGKIVGLHQWTRHIATREDVSGWKQQSYNIGLILGRSEDEETPVLMAIDVDVESESIQKALYAILTSFLNKDIPYRGRENSARRAYLVKAKATGKTVIQLPKGEDGKQEAVELLCKGQQIAVAGRHPSGSRYVWHANETSEEAYQLRTWDIPVLSEEQLIDLWKAIAVALDVPEVPLGKANARTRDLSSVNADATDDIAEWLDANGKVIETDKHGTRYLYSFRDESEYSSEFKTGDIVYYPAGTGGYAEGAFKCLHATDAGMTRNDILNAYGYTVAQFDIIPDDKPKFRGVKLSDVLKNCDFNAKTGTAKLKGFDTLCDAVKCEELMGMRFAYDLFTSKMQVANLPDGKYRILKDKDVRKVRRILDSKFEPSGREDVRQAVVDAAEDDEFDSAINMLNTAEYSHDGKKRVEMFLHSYFGVEDTEYSRAVSLYIWTAIAGRILDPGCAVDMIPVLYGKQSIGKSKGIRAMAPEIQHAGKMNFSDKEVEALRCIQGKLIVEIAELRGLHTKDAETIKDFITTQSDEYRKMYTEDIIEHPRRMLFIANTNNKDFLTDPTGNRRWLPVTATKVNIEAISKDRKQLLAEGRDLYLAKGILFRKAEELARAEHENYRLEDPWEELIRCWLYSDSESPKPVELPYLQAKDITMFALGQDAGRFDSGKGRRLSGVMLSLGYERTRMSIDIELNGVTKKVQTRVYVKKQDKG